MDLLADPACLNLTVGGEGGPTRLGARHSKESKERISRSLRGHVISVHTRAKIGAKSKGRNKGKTLSEEQRRKLSKALTGIPSKLKGTPRTPETKARISISVKAHLRDNPRTKQSKPKSNPEIKRNKLSKAAKQQWADPVKRQRLLEARHKEPPKLTIYCDLSRHLICVPYSIPNLHYMARSLGIGRHFFHRNASYPHYDIPKRRVEEITAKCLLVSTRDLLKFCKG